MVSDPRKDQPDQPKRPLTALQRFFRYRASSSGSDPIVPPLLALPPEILFRIIDCSVGTSDPTLALLRRTHRVFFHLIPPADVRSRTSKKNIAQQLCAAEERYSFLFPPDHLVCFTCLYGKPKTSFADDKLTQRAKWGRKQHKRYCLQCGIRNGEYQKPGMCFAIQGVEHYLCRRCWKPYPALGGRSYGPHTCSPDPYPLCMLAVSSAVFLVLLPLLNPAEIVDVFLLQPLRTYREHELKVIAKNAIRQYMNIKYFHRIGRL